MSKIILEKAMDPFDPMWKGDWINFFNEEVCEALFGERDLLDEIDKEARKYLSRIKEIHTKVKIGNNLEMEFLGLCILLDKLGKEKYIPSLKEDLFNKNTPYFVAKNCLLNNWFEERLNAIFFYINYFASFGKPNKIWYEWMKNIKEYFDLGHTDLNLAMKIMRLESSVEKVKLNGDKSEEFIEIINQLERLNNALGIFIRDYNETSIICDDKETEIAINGHNKTKILDSYSHYWSDELKLIRYMKKGFQLTKKKPSTIGLKMYFLQVKEKLVQTRNAQQENIDVNANIQDSINRQMESPKRELLQDDILKPALSELLNKK